MVNMSKLANKVAIVTGASKGIGGGIATALGAAGARVAVNYSSDRGGAERVAQAITDSGGEASAVGLRRISLDHRRSNSGRRRPRCGHLRILIFVNSDYT
jgi:NAD(P)-dependent dehydrogenase (short-subunit alcohol dehydrogenase family)